MKSNRQESNRRYWSRHRERIAAARAAFAKPTTEMLIEWYKADREQERLAAAAYRANKIARAEEDGIRILLSF